METAVLLSPGEAVLLSHSSLKKYTEISDLLRSYIKNKCTNKQTKKQHTAHEVDCSQISRTDTADWNN